MLDIRNISAGYTDSAGLSGLVLRDLSLQVPPAQITCIMGRNGAGKTTLLKAIMGLVPLRDGQICLDGQRLDQLAAHKVASHGIGYVPQGRRLFGDMTVAENLEIGLMVPRIHVHQPAIDMQPKGCEDRADIRRAEQALEKPSVVKERVLTLFPRLAERLGQVSRSLSGGEQQMLAIARALCLQPQVLMLDEPSEGLQPSMITLISDVLKKLKDQGVAVVLVEQRVEAALSLADQIAFMVRGSVVETRPAAGLDRQDAAFAKYVGV